MRALLPRLLLLLLAVVARGASLVALDLDPELVGKWPRAHEQPLTGGVVEGDHAYCTTDRALVIFDVSDLFAPRVVGSLDGLKLAGRGRLTVSGGYAYLTFPGPAAGKEETLPVNDACSLKDGNFFDIYPFHLEEAARVDVSLESLEFEPSLILRDDRCRIVEHINTECGADGICLGAALPPGERVFAAGGRVHVMTVLDLEVIDVSDPRAPRWLGSHALPDICHDASVVGSHAFLAWTSGLDVVNLGDPSNPRLAGRYATSGIPRGVAAAGEYAYVADEVLGLEVIDASDPARPFRTSGNPILGAGRILPISTRGTTVFVHARERGLVVFELWRPFPPVSVSAAGGDGAVEISWSPPAGGIAPAGYDVYRTSPGPRTRLNARPVAGTSFTVSGLPNGVEHCFAVQASSAGGAASEDSAPACAVPEGPLARFLRGDCDGDGRVEGLVTDAVFLLDHNFRGGPKPPCLAACDADGDGRVEGIVTDAVYLLNFNFLGGPPPAAPFPECGPGGLGTDGEMGCETYTEVCK